MSLEYKSVPFEVKATGSAESGWEIAGLASTFWGTPDAYGDVVAPGAFTATIAERPTKFLYEHDEPIGKQLELRETDAGLYGRWSVVDTRAGTDAHKLAAAGVLDSLSIGYIPLEWEIRGDGVRVLQKVDLYEVSCVAIPANPNAVITDVKHAEADDVTAYIGRLLARHRSMLALSTKEGRAISAARRERMATVSGSLKDAAAEIDAMLAETATEKALSPDLEHRRRRLARRGIVVGA